MLLTFKGTSMEYLTKTIDEFLDDPSTTDSKVFDLVSYILTEHRLGILQEFCSKHITVDNAADVAFASPYVCDDYFEINGLEPELIMNHMPPKQLAYHLTFTEPAKATELLDELLYYRKNGRI